MTAALAGNARVQLSPARLNARRNRKYADAGDIVVLARKTSLEVSPPQIRPESFRELHSVPQLGRRVSCPVGQLQTTSSLSVSPEGLGSSPWSVQDDDGRHSAARQLSFSAYTTDDEYLPVLREAQIRWVVAHTMGLPPKRPSKVGFGMRFDG